MIIIPMLKKRYFYFYYKLYRLFDNENVKWCPEARAFALLLLAGALAFQAVTSCIAIQLGMKQWLTENAKEFYTVFFIIFAVYNYIVFLHKDRWKAIVKSFLHEDRKTNIIGAIIVYFILLTIAAVWVYFVFAWRVAD